MNCQKKFPNSQLSPPFIEVLKQQFCSHSCVYNTHSQGQSTMRPLYDWFMCGVANQPLLESKHLTSWGDFSFCVGTNTYNHSFFIKLNEIKKHMKNAALYLQRVVGYSTFQFLPLVHQPRVCPRRDDLAAGILFCERPRLRVDQFCEVFCWYSRRCDRRPCCTARPASIDHYAR